MIKKENIQQIVNAHLEGASLFLVDVTIKPGNNINVFIDSVAGIGIDDCVSVSKHIESCLDRDVEDYALQVSSAGIDSPFKVLKQYEKNVGKQVKVITTEKKEMKGILLKVSVESITLDVPARKKTMPSEQLVIPMTEIKSTSLIITFN